MSNTTPSFDLVVATVGRTSELEQLLESLAAQEYPQVRVLLVDQNDDDRVRPLVDTCPLEVLHLRSERGLSRARNVALRRVSADVVAFPDDDCVYPAGLLAQIAVRLGEGTALDGLTGRSTSSSGLSSPSWKRSPAILTDDNLWNRAISYTIFLRRAVVERVGSFDERLGLGSYEPWSSGEETDYLIRAVHAGAHILYDPSLVVVHDVRVDDARIGYRDGASVGYLLRKHRYPARVVARMFARPVGGIARGLVNRDWSSIAYYAASLRGRLSGYRGARRSKIAR